MLCSGVIGLREASCGVCKHILKNDHKQTGIITNTFIMRLNSIFLVKGISTTVEYYVTNATNMDHDVT